MNTVKNISCCNDIEHIYEDEDLDMILSDIQNDFDF